MDTASTSKDTLPPIKIIDAIIQGETLLRDARLTHTPRLESEMLMAHATGLERTRLIAAYKDPLDPAPHKYFRSCIKRRLQAEPIAYIVSKKEFMGHTFRIDRRALIPRPETEILVEHVLDLTTPSSPEGCLIADIGTGSGCIAISLALSLPGATIHATDISHDVLELARENAEVHGVADRLEFHTGDTCSALPARLKDSFDAIISNPPYISDSEYAGLEIGIRDFEPPSALRGGPDGLDTIRRIAGQASQFLKNGGLLALEIGEAQADDVAILLKRVASLSLIQVFRDLAKKDRVIVGRKI